MNKATKRHFRDVLDINPKKSRTSEPSTLEEIDFSTICLDITREIFLFVLNNEENTQKSAIQLVCSKWKKVYDSLLKERLDIFLRKKPYSYLQRLVYLRSLEMGIMEAITNDHDKLVRILKFVKGKFVILEDLWREVPNYDDGYYINVKELAYEPATLYKNPGEVKWHTFCLNTAIIGSRKKNHAVIEEACMIFTYYKNGATRHELVLPKTEVITPALKQVISEINAQYKLF